MTHLEAFTFFVVTGKLTLLVIWIAAHFIT